MSVPSSTLLKNTLKLVLAGATIAGIAWTFLIVSPDGSVTESQADIIDLEILAPQTKTQKFVASLDSLGHEKPRIYDYNGTQVFFSTRSTPLKPRDLIHEYQESFVAHGVNTRIWQVTPDTSLLDDPEKLQRYAATQRRQMLDGELQVIYHSDDRIVMSGAVIDSTPTLNLVVDHDDPGPVKPFVIQDFQKLFKMHRYVEAEWNPITRNTTVTASWSDEDFDISKALTKDFQEPHTRHLNNSPDLEVPSCLACTRLTRFATVAHDKPFITQVFESTESAQSVAAFYRDAMTSSGWTIMPGDSLKTHLADSADHGTELLQFQREGRFVTITIEPPQDDGLTMISTMTTD